MPAVSLLEVVDVVGFRVTVVGSDCCGISIIEPSLMKMFAVCEPSEGPLKVSLKEVCLDLIAA